MSDPEERKRASNTGLPTIAPAFGIDLRGPVAWGDRIRGWVREGWIFGVLLALIVLFSILSPSFVSLANWRNLSSTAIVVVMLAVAQTFLIVSGQIDLSQGGVLALSGVAAGWVMVYGMPGQDPVFTTIVGFGVALLVGVLIGLANGLVVAKGNMNPFIVTLATMGIATGLALVLTGGLPISTIPPLIGDIGRISFGNVLSIPVLVVIVAVVISALVMAKTRFGSNTYVIGDNRDAAERAGINVVRHSITLFVISSLFAAIASVLLMMRLSIAQPAGSTQDLLNAIAGAVIGGASLTGGRGSVVKSAAGGIIITVLLIGLVIVNVAYFWQQVAVGLVLVLAVYIDQRSRATRRGRPVSQKPLKFRATTHHQ